VTVSDEAFVWQVMTYYYPIWMQTKSKDVTRDEESIVGSVLSGGRSGPKRGFVKTAGKTIKTYNEYITLMGKLRSAPNAKLWSDRLKLVAQMTAQETKKGSETKEPDVSVSPVLDFLQYTKFDLCGMEEDEEDENDGEKKHATTLCTPGKLVSV
jgi:hypothetical protein